MSKGAILILLIIAFGFCFAPKADGAVVTISIEAVVDTVEDEGNYLEGQILPGNIITGYYTYESTTPDSNPLLNGGRYEYLTPPYGIFLSVGGFDFQTDPANVDFILEITNDYPPNDDYLVRSYSNIPLPNGTLVERISWWLNDDSGAALVSTELPVTAPVLSNWPLNNLTIVSDRTFNIDAHVTSAIPEPGTILIFCLGGLFLRKGKFLW